MVEGQRHGEDGGPQEQPPGPPGLSPHAAPSWGNTSLLVVTPEAMLSRSLHTRHVAGGTRHRPPTSGPRWAAGPEGAKQFSAGSGAGGRLRSQAPAAGFDPSVSWPCTGAARPPCTMALHPKTGRGATSEGGITALGEPGSGSVNTGHLVSAAVVCGLRGGRRLGVRGSWLAAPTIDHRLPEPTRGRSVFSFQITNVADATRPAEGPRRPGFLGSVRWCRTRPVKSREEN